MDAPFSFFVLPRRPFEESPFHDCVCTCKERVALSCGPSGLLIKARRIVRSHPFLCSCFMFHGGGRTRIRGDGMETLASHAGVVSRGRAQVEPICYQATRFMGGVGGPRCRKTLRCSKHRGASNCVDSKHGSLPLGGRPSSSVLASSTFTWHCHSVVSCSTFVARAAVFVAQGRPPPPLPSVEKKLRGWLLFPPIGHRWGRPPV